jgi:hypothetical protein
MPYAIAVIIETGDLGFGLDWFSVHLVSLSRYNHSLNLRSLRSPDPRKRGPG